MLLKDFSGGINTRVAPSLINANESQVCTNIDATSGSIKPVKSSVLSKDNVGLYFTYYYANKEFYSRNTESSFVEYKDILYMTRYNDSPAKYDGINLYRLGIVKPSSAPVVTVPSAYLPTPEKAPIHQDSSDFATLAVGTYKIAYSYYNSATDTQSKLSEPLTVTLDESNTTGIKIRIESDITGVTDIRLYMIVPGDTEFKFHNLLPPITQSYTIVDMDVTTKYVYPLYDSVYTYCYTYYNSIDGTESQPSDMSENEIVADSIDVNVTASNDSQVDKIRLYRIGDSIPSFTLVDTFNNVNATHTITSKDIDIAGNHILDSYTYNEAPNNLKYLTESYAMLFGAIGDKLYYSDIAKPNVWPVTNFIDFDDDVTGIGALQNGLLVFTKFKTYLITGNSPSTFSKYLLDSSQGCINPYSIAFAKGAILWLSNDGICTTSGGGVEVITQTKLGKLTLNNPQNAVVYDNVYYLLHDGGILVIDFRFNMAIRTLDIEAQRLGVYLDKFYIQKYNSLYELFEGTPLTYTYKSGLLTEGQYTNYKVFKDFYIKYNGDITLSLYIDKKLVNTVNLTGDKCYNLKALASSKGYGIEFEITGTGEVNEIQYTVLPRQNGK